MSTSILGKVTRIHGAREDLSRYVRRILTQKRLSLRDVERDSGNKITQGYVGAIVNGRYANPSIDKLKALARGIGESEEEVFRVARGLTPTPTQERAENEDGLQMATLLELMQKIVAEPELVKLVQELVDMPPATRKVLFKVLRSLNDDEEPGPEVNRLRG